MRNNKNLHSITLELAVDNVESERERIMAVIYGLFYFIFISSYIWFVILEVIVING